MSVGHPSVAPRRTKARVEVVSIAGEFGWEKPSVSQFQVMIASVESKSDLRQVIRLCHSRIAKLESQAADR